MDHQQKAKVDLFYKLSFFGIVFTPLITVSGVLSVISFYDTTDTIARAHYRNLIRLSVFWIGGSLLTLVLFTWSWLIGFVVYACFAYYLIRALIQSMRSLNREETHSVR